MTPASRVFIFSQQLEIVPFPSGVSAAFKP
jgi:hypothetical protein